MNRVRLCSSPTVALSLAFDHVSLDQREARCLRLEQEVFMIPISLGSIVVILLVLWLVGVI